MPNVRRTLLVLTSVISVVASTACSGPAEPAPGPVTPPPAPEPTAAAPVPVESPTTAARATPPAPTAAPTAVASAPPPAPAAPACPEGMALVPGGEFVMSAIKQKVTVEPFCLDVNEVTAGAYAECVKAGKCDKTYTNVCDPFNFGVAGKEKQPIVCVDFPQSEAYCKAQGKRLPALEEWEWAARGGAEGRIFPWGNDAPADQLCWSGKDKHDGPCDVGSFPKGDNPQGIHDLSGGVFEWTTTKNDSTSTQRFGRGGSWRDGVPEIVKVARNGSFKTTYRCGFLGIRCATKAP